MKELISERVGALSPSATFEMARRSAELAAQGVDVVNMSVGEPDFPTPDHIREAAVAAIDAGYTKYSAVSGYTSLKEAVCHKLLSENGLSYTPSQIIISSGAKQSICNAVLALVNPGDEVIIPAPFWVSYPQMALLAGGVPVHVRTGIEQDFKMTPGQLEAAISSRTKLLILCSPSNPSGAVYSVAELEALAEVIMRHEGLMVLSDEIYEHINYTGSHASITSIPGMEERTIVVNGVSKSYAMTGWRIGYMAAPRWLADACSMLQGQYTSGPSSISQKAAETALLGSQECVEQMRLSFLRRRNVLVSLMKQIPGLRISVPDGAFYLLPDCSAYLGKSYKGMKISSASDLAMYLLTEGHVATVGGDPFGAPGCIRLSYATSEDVISEGVSRIASALARLV
ncbi:MAG: pyridoxal phosphate-dependent aminotransferase [Bacteroidales bacterium]|nr:pyridoxal phosphate-dependent aminotransferase [Bacteroidales bacterium]